VSAQKRRKFKPLGAIMSRSLKTETALTDLICDMLARMSMPGAPTLYFGVFPTNRKSEKRPNWDVFFTDSGTLLDPIFDEIEKLQDRYDLIEDESPGPQLG